MTIHLRTRSRPRRRSSRLPGDPAPLQLLLLRWQGRRRGRCGTDPDPTNDPTVARKLVELEDLVVSILRDPVLHDTRAAHGAAIAALRRHRATLDDARRHVDYAQQLLESRPGDDRVDRTRLAQALIRARHASTAQREALVTAELTGQRLAAVTEQLEDRARRRGMRRLAVVQRYVEAYNSAALDHRAVPLDDLPDDVLDRLLAAAGPREVLDLDAAPASGAGDSRSAADHTTTDPIDLPDATTLPAAGRASTLEVSR